MNQYKKKFVKYMAMITLCILSKVLMNIYLFHLENKWVQLKKKEYQMYKEYNMLVLEYENLKKEMPIEILAKKLNMLKIQKHDFIVFNFDIEKFEKSLYD